MPSGIGAIAAPPRLLIVVGFAIFVAFAGLWTLPPLDRDESRFAQATAQMLETGDFVAIRLQEKERNKKPIGIHWLQAASVALFSDVEARRIWAYRLPSALGVVLAAIFTFLAARRLYDRRTAFLAGMLLAGAPIVAAEATIAKTDGFLLAMICMAQYAFIEIYGGMKEGRAAGWRWPLLFWTALGAGVLIKGPIAPMACALTALGLAARREKLPWRAAMRPALGLTALSAMIAPWAIAIGVATQGRFFTEAISVDMVGKIGSAQEGHAGPPGYHLALVWALFWPAAALLGPGLAQIWRERAAWQAHFLLAWIIPAWIIFELTATKLPHYVLPLYPALAILAARAAAAPPGEHKVLRRLGAAGYGVVGLLCAAAIVLARLFLGDGPVPIAALAASALVALAAILIAGAFWTGRAYAGAIAAAALAGVFAWIVMAGVLPGLSALQVSPRLSAALEDAGRHPLKNHVAPVALAGYHEPSAVFLLGTATRLVDGRGAARDLAEGRVSAAFVEAREIDAFLSASAAAALHPAPLAVIEGLNYSNGDRVALTLFVRNGGE